MKNVKVILSMVLISLGITSASLISTKNNSINVSQNTSVINSEYQYIKQDGYIDLGYSATKDNNIMLQSSSINMVNFDMNTRSQSFETFNPDSYAKRSGTASMSLIHSSKNVPENTNEITIHSSMIDGKECLYTEGYLPIDNETNKISVLANSNDPNDNRKIVSNSKTSPYLATGRIVSYYYNVKNNVNGYYYTIYTLGTGFLEGPNIMATAAHCVYGDVTVNNYDDGKYNPRFPDVMEFYPGLDGISERNTSYLYYCKAKTINITASYYNNTDANNDWAAVELDRNIGYSTGWNGKISNWYNKSSKVFTYGYPGDKNDTMWYAEGKIKSKENGYKYETDVYGVAGQSGSAYFMTDSNNNTYVWGILTHNYTYDNWETISGTSGVYINSFIFHYLNSFVTNHNYEHVAATIRPSDYGFADAYPTSATTNTHKLNTGFEFTTTRYRTGFIQGEYIVMSPFRNNITKAYIEYNFNVPITKIEVDLTHWRSLSHEWTYSSNCIAELRTKNGYKLDLLSKEMNLPTDRTKPTTYTIVFDKPTYSFGFYMESKKTNVNDNNRGRLCIANMKVYTTEGWF